MLHHNSDTPLKLKDMKTLFTKTIALLLVALSLPVLSLANDEFKKEIKKTFSANEIKQLVLKNKFGDVDLITSETNTIEVEVSIIVEADNKEEANEVFADINIDLRQADGTVFAETIIKDRNNKVKFKINYRVKMPLSVETDITNKFGGVYANELVGYHSLKLGYGSLKIDRLINKKDMKRANVYLAYSNGKIATCEWLNIDIKYSKLNVSESRAIVLNSKYSKINIDKSSSIVAISKYDSRFRVGTINNIKVSGAYSNYQIGTLNNKIIVDIKYSDLNVERVASSVKNAKLGVKYGKISFPLSPEHNFYLEASANYGDIDVDNESKFRKTTDNHYIELKGYTGGSETERKITGTAKYGSLDFSN